MTKALDFPAGLARLTVRLLGADRQLVAGQDNPPARPVGSWLLGEVITDVHPIAAGERFGQLYEHGP